MLFIVLFQIFSTGSCRSAANKLHLIKLPPGFAVDIYTDQVPGARSLAVSPAGSGFEVFARGVRNTVGFDWHPETGELWFTDNGRDRLGDDLPPDELNRAPVPGRHFGFPYIHGRDIPGPELCLCKDRSLFTPPAMELGPHVGALGMRFYTGDMFPPEYHNQILIAEHASWNRSVPIGYRLS